MQGHRTIQPMGYHESAKQGPDLSDLPWTQEVPNVSGEGGCRAGLVNGRPRLALSGLKSERGPCPVTARVLRNHRMDDKSSLTPALSHRMGEGAQGAGEGSLSCLPMPAHETRRRQRGHSLAVTGRKARTCSGDSLPVPPSQGEGTMNSRPAIPPKGGRNRVIPLGLRVARASDFGLLSGFGKSAFGFQAQAGGRLSCVLSDVPFVRARGRWIGRGGTTGTRCGLPPPRRCAVPPG